MTVFCPSQPFISYNYDGTFDGFLSVIFEAYRLKKEPLQINRPGQRQEALFSDALEVKTETEHADRVWIGLGKKLSGEARHGLYQAFLSEQPDVEMLLFRYIKKVLASNLNEEKNYSNPDVLEVIKLARRVWREQHRMEAFVRFNKLSDGTFLSVISPDFNVLPLICKHFTSRYADQPWIIYDARRHTGLHYNLEQVQEVSLPAELIRNRQLKVNEDALDIAEPQFQELWQQYFQSVNIPERKNPKLHVRHIPKRYWRYLSEKQPEEVRQSAKRIN